MLIIFTLHFQENLFQNDEAGLSNLVSPDEMDQNSEDGLTYNEKLDEEMTYDEEINTVFDEDDIFFDADDGTEQDGYENERDSEDIDKKPLYPGAKITVGAFMLLMALFFTKHNCVGDAIQQLLNIFAYVLPDDNVVCSSLYSYKKYFNQLKNPIKKHYYCPKCLNSVKDNIADCENQNCRHSLTRGSNPYFLQSSIIEQLRTFFSKEGFFEALQHRFSENHHNSTIKDITDGFLYKSLSSNNGLLSEPENISFVLNTDGAPVFKSSRISIWPIFLTINELEISKRMMPENMLLAGLWFDSIKPSIEVFLNPILEEFKQLSKGVQFFSPTKGMFLCKGFLLACTADLPARALLCNSVLFNGAFSCIKCLQKGETAKRGKGHTHIFPFKSVDPKGPVRSTKSILQDAETVMRSGRSKYTVNGIKGPSWLAFFPKFDIVNGMGIDYMHGVLLGVQKLLLKLWFGKEFSSQTFSVFSKLKTVDQRLLNIHPTLSISRLPRSIESDFKHWKASEFQNFLLFYSLPVLKDILDQERFLHFALFVQAIFILLQNEITVSELKKSEEMLKAFCKKFADLYSACFMTLNMHQLLHLVDNVINLGPLYTHSCFPFEDKNGLVLKMIKGSQNIDQQIVTGISFLQKLPELRHSCITKETYLEYLCNSIEFPNILKRKKEIGPGIYLLGGITLRRLSQPEQQAYELYLKDTVQKDLFQTLNRLELNGQILYGIEYLRMKKRNNATVLFKYEDINHYGNIRFFILTDNQTEVLAVISCLNRTGQNMQVQHIAEVVDSGNLKVVSVNDIAGLCLCVAFEDKTYVCTFPNTLYFL